MRATTTTSCRCRLAADVSLGRRDPRLDLAAFDVFTPTATIISLRRSPPIVRTMHGSCFAEALHIHGAKARLRMFALGTHRDRRKPHGDRLSPSRRTLAGSTRGSAASSRTASISNGSTPGEKEPTPTILFVGTYEHRKRGRLLMEVFADEVRPTMPDARLWMVCSDAPPAPGVEVLGRLTDEELAERYRRAWVFCLPSTYEGFGVPYIEAMASRTRRSQHRIREPTRSSKAVRSAGLWSRKSSRAALSELLSNESERRYLASVGQHGSGLWMAFRRRGIRDHL